MPRVATIKSKSQKRSGKYHPWYEKQLWRTHIRKAQLKKQPICQQCKTEGKLNDKQLEIDHIIPFQSGQTEAEQWRLFTDMDNLRTLCKRHHSMKSGKK